MTDTHRPTFQELDESACQVILGRNHVGRLAFTFKDHVDIEPINYVYADRWIYGRTAPGTKLTTLLHVPWVAFEVDEVEGVVDWQSVVVHGTVYFLDPEEVGTRSDYQTAVGHLRTVLPAVFEADDPAPLRTVVFRIHADTITGRRASSHKARPTESRQGARRT